MHDQERTTAMLLKNRVAFVTAAASGIGAAGARALAREGAYVVVTDRNGEGAEAVARELLREGYRAEAHALDVTSDEEVREAIDETAQRHGRLDILHSHAGLQVEGRLEDVDVGDMDASWALNVRAHFVAAQAAIGPMRAQRGGSIIITSSNSGVQYDRGMIAYCTTKHAVLAMTRQMAADYASENIRFNALCPGFIDTPFNRGFEIQMGGRAQLEDYIASSIPMGRFGTVEEIADSIVFLASDRSSFMTGHALVVDGGECILSVWHFSD
jgi:NAD(P)-dependent dehydrogenase (short-subunit alcohol dehydrogenase family)